MHATLDASVPPIAWHGTALAVDPYAAMPRAQAQLLRRDYYAAVSWVDAQVGRVLQALADPDTLALSDALMVCDAHPEPVPDNVPKGVALGQLLGLKLPLTEPEKEVLPEAEPQDVPETETLELGVSVPECEAQPELVMEGEALDDTVGQLDGLTLRLAVALTLCEPEVEGQALPVRDTVQEAHMEGEAEGERE